MALPRAGEIVDNFKFLGGDPNSPDSWEELPSALPQPGSVIDGYVFKGGDPNDQTNWQSAAEAEQSAKVDAEAQKIKHDSTPSAGLLGPRETPKMEPYQPKSTTLSEKEQERVEFASAKDMGNVVRATGKYGSDIADELSDAEQQVIEGELATSKNNDANRVLREQLMRPKQNKAPLDLSAREIAAIDPGLDTDIGPSIETSRGPEATLSNVASGVGASLGQGAELTREGIRAQWGDAIGSDDMAEDALRKAEQIRGERDRMTPEFESPLFRAAYGGLVSVIQQVPGIAASIATGSPVPALISAGLQTEAEAYTRYRERGAEGIEAITGALGEGAVEVITEFTPMRFLVDKFGKAAATKVVAGFIARDAAPEQVATLAQDAIDTAIANPDKTWGDYLAERPMAAFDTLVATVVQAGVIGGASAAARRLAGGDIQPDPVDTSNVRPDEPDQLGLLKAAQAEEQANAQAALEAITEADTVEDAIKLAEAAVSAPLTTIITQEPAFPSEAINAAEILDDIQTPEVAAGASQAEPDQLEGSGGNVLSNPDATGLATAETPAQSSIEGESVLHGNQPDNALETYGQLADDIAAPVQIARIGGKNSGETISVQRDGDLLRVLYNNDPVIDYETEKEVTVPANASIEDIKKAVKASGQFGRQIVTFDKTYQPSMAPAAEAVKGDAIDDNWTAFANDSGSLGIPRDQMPQIKSEHRGAMTNFLNARGIDHAQEEVPASSLKPTQAEFSQSKVDKAKGFEGGDRSILISQDGHVLDGHHQWLAKLENNEPVPVIRLNAPIQKLLQEVREFPSAKTSTGATPEKNERFERNRSVLQAWLPDMAWAERGGQIIRDSEGQVTGRTKWMPKDYDLEAIRKDLGNIPYTAMQKAVQKALDGKPLSKKEKLAVDALMDFAESMAPVTDAELETVSDELTMDEQEALALLMHDVEWDQLLADTAIDDNALVSISKKAQNAADEFERLLGAYYETELESQNETLPGETDARGTGARTESRYQPGADEIGQDAARQEQSEGSNEGLTSYSQQDLAARDQAKADQRKADEAASKKAEADSQVNDFVLTGSDRPADQAAARGAQDLFGQPTSEVKPSSSWVIRNKETGEVIMETFDRKKVDALNTTKYEAVPIQEYLSSLNARTASIDDITGGGWRVNFLQAGELQNTKDFDDRAKAETERINWERGTKPLDKPYFSQESDLDDAATKGFRAGLEGDQRIPSDLTDQADIDAWKIGNRRGLDESKNQPDRRTNTEQRKRVEQMSADEMRKALLVDDLTGLGNRRAYDESEKLPVQVSVDVDSLKWVNDNMGHESGDVMLKAVGEAIGRVTANGYHVSGDEFIVQTNTVEEADSIMANVRQALDNAEIEAETPSGELITKQGLGVSYGTGSTLTEAERGLQQDKSNREQTGQRAGRGETPSGVARKPAGGQQDQERDTAELDSQPVPAGSVRITKSDSGYSASYADDVLDFQSAEIDSYLDDAFKRKIFDGVIGQDITLDEASKLLLDDAVNNSDAYTGILPKPIEIGVEPRKSPSNNEQKPDTPLSIFDNAMDEYDKGIANVDDYKAAFQNVLDHEKDITDYLNTLTKKQLFDRGGYNLEARYKSEKKERVVSALYSEMVSDFLLPGESGMRSYSASFGGNRYDGIKQQVEAITQDSLNKAMQRLQDARKANAEKKAEQLKGIADPQTLDDYTNLLRTKMADGVTLKDARMSLTPEQRAKYDELYAERTMADRAGRKEAQKTDIRTAGQTVSGDIIETKHTKKGHDLFVVQLSERVSREDYETLNTGAKKLDGYYSSYRGGGAVPGFQFTERANAEAFVELAGGNKDAAQEAIKARRDAYEDDRAQSAVERLTEMAGKLEEAGQEDLNRDRKANTHRRAEAAARAEAKANAQIAMAKTMRNIATAIDSGEAKFLGKVRQKVQVELLQGAVNTGHYTMLREKYKDYREYEKHKDAPPTMEAADYAEFPQYTLFRSDWAKLGRQLSETEGTKALGKKILSIADDVSDAYVKWAKDNLLQVSLVGSNGERAVFSTKDLAERTIERSAFRGKAIPISFKRGEHMIVLSPSEAQLRGFWQGDDDKRITLNSEFGKELVEKVGKLNRRNSKVELPWQLESAHDKREKYARMGIENPSEFRAALREFIQYKETPPQPDKVKEMERKMIGRRNDGLDFFPTPAAVADEMIEAAGLEEGMSVLEPSAGMGHIAERIREAGVEPDVVELSGDRRELLEAKGFNLVASDFMDVSGQYDRIIMNPPFSDRRDEQHVRHAYNLLKPGGRLVAIMGEGVFFGSDKRATEFREWLESVGGTSEKLEEGTFMDPSLPVNTGVAARMVVIEKQDGPLFSRSPMKSVDANEARGNQNMNQALLDRADVRRAMYHNELGWIDFVWGDNKKGVQHIIHSRMGRDGYSVDGTYRLLTNDLVKTIASGETIRRSARSESERVVIRGDGNEAVLVRNKGGNGWLLTGFELVEPVDQGRVATTPGLRSNAPTLSRSEEVAALKELSALARENVNAAFSRAPTFYSQMSRVIEQSMGNAEPVAQLKMKVQAWAKQGKFKQDELQWSGLMEWLDMQSGKVQKQAVLDYLDANGVQVTDAMLSTDVPADLARIFKNEGYEFQFDEYEDGFSYIDPDGDLIDFDDLPKNLQDAVNKAVVGQEAPRYGKYTVPGGDNYKELLLTLPLTENSERVSGYILPSNESMADDILFDISEAGLENLDYGRTENSDGLEIIEFSNFDYRSWQKVQEIANRHGRVAKETERKGSKPVYQSSHFSQPNILAHVRFDERTDADGKRVLFINEIQSDWGQGGKKKGFKLNALSDAEQMELESLGAIPYSELTQTQVDSFHYLQSKQKADAGVPPAPFVTKTDAWVALAIKRMARYAAENGFDRVAFINGDQAADLYDLSKQVKEITVGVRGDERFISVDDINGKEIADMQVANDGTIIKSNREFDGKNLEDVIGKDLANKILASPEPMRLRGLDLKVGGEGMKTFYNRIVPNVARDVLKKIGGNLSTGAINGQQREVKPSWTSTEVEFKTNPTEQLGFDITPEMRDQIMQGLPLFSKAGSGAGLSVSEVQATVDLLKQKWENAPEIVVVQDMRDPAIRKVVRDENERQLSQDASGQPVAFFDAGKVYIVASAMGSRRNVIEAMFHETLGHYGLRGTFGDALKPILNEVSVARRKDVIAKAKQYGLDINNERDRLIAAEEVLAEMAQTKPELSFVQRAIAAIRTWLRKFIPDLTMTDAEIIWNILEPARDFVIRGRSEQGAGDMVPAFQRKNQTETDAFKRWFGDSKVVDKDGKPLVVYHGTIADFSEFDPDASVEGTAFWFTASPEHSNSFTGAPTGGMQPNIMPVYLSMSNPYVRSGRSIPQDHDPLVIEELIETAKKRGHDGIIIRNFRDSSAGVADTYVVFDPAKIKSATGNNGNFDPDNADIRFKRQSSLTPEWRDLEDSKMDAVIYALQDKHIDLKRVTQNIKKAAGDIHDRWNAYLQEELFHGRSAKRTEDFIKTELEPLINDMRARGVAMADFEEFLWARHAEERNEQIAKINPDMPDGGSGMTTDEAREYLAGLKPEQKRAYEALAKRVDAINRKSRQILIDYGLESADTIAAWESAYDHYVPLMREDMNNGFGNGTGQGYSVRGNSAKRATGSKRAVVDILANIAQQRERNIIRGEKNRVSTALIGLAKLNPNPDFWKTDSIPMIKTIGADGLVTEVPDQNYKNRDNVIVARIVNREGRVVEHSVIFNQFDERAMRMAASLKNLDQDQIGELLGTASVITRYFASINTQYNPIFGVLNITRDVQGALLNLSSTELAGKQKDVMSHVLPALRGIYIDVRNKRKGKQTDSVWAELWEEFQREGGQTGYRDMFKNAKMRSEAIEHALDPEWWTKNKVGKVLTANGFLTVPEQYLADKAVKPLFDWLSDYNLTLENSVRLAAYKVAKEQGLTNQQAASLAKNLTVNFNRKGEMGRQVGALYAFFNASVQGTSRLAQTMTGPAGKRIAMGGMLLGVLQAVTLAMAGFDDEEPPEFIRDRNIVIPIGGDKYITIPMPLGFNVLPATGRIATEWVMDGFRDPGKRFVHLLDVVADMFNPVGNAGLSTQTILPTAFDPLGALAENKDFTGRPIAREDFSSLDPTPGHTRAKDTASSFGKAISYGINRVSGGTDYKPGAVSPTPDQIDYLIGQLTGGVGREAMKVEQTATSAVTGEDLPTYKIPLVGRFYGDSSGQSSQASRFYDNIRELNEHENELKGLRSDGKSTEEYRQEHPEARLIHQARTTYKIVGDLRKRVRKLREQGAPKEKIQQVEDRITRHMQRLNEKFEAKKETAAI